MTLEQLVNRFDGAERSIVVVNRTDPDPVMKMLVDTFGDDAVDVVDTTGRFGDGTQRAATDRGRGSGRDAVGGLTDAVDGLTRAADRLTDAVGLPTEDVAGTTEDTPRETEPDSEWAADRPRHLGADIEEVVSLPGVPGADASSGSVIDIGALRRNDAVPFDGTDPETLENLALLVEGDEVIAGSTLDELGKAVLFVNSDLYTTGSRTLRDLDLPAVITRLEDAVFTLRGYPKSNREKLLLITMSRFVERAAWTAGDGTLRSSFQRLSRLDDEAGTREVYESVAEAGVDTHLYGVPDDLPRGLDAVVHGGDSPDFTDSWFVVYRPPGGPEAVDGEPLTDLERGVRGGVGLLAVERDSRVWEGTWTFDPGRLRELNGYVERNL